MRSSTTTKVKSMTNNTNKDADYDSDFTEFNEPKTKAKTYSSRTPSSDSSKTKSKPTKTTKNQNSRSYSTESRTNSSRTISRSRSRSRSVSKSRSLSPVNKNSKNITKTKGNNLSNFKARSTDIYDNKKNTGKSSKHSDIYPTRKNVYNNKPVNKPNQRGKNNPPIAGENLSQAALRVMSAQRHKNTDLQNRLAELNIELEKLREENKTMRRVHLREEIAIKRFVSQDTDLNRMIRNHSDETNSLKEKIKSLKTENRRLNSNLIDKEEEVRSVRKKNDEYKKILSDKKLLDSSELSKSLEQADKELQELKTKLENQERKIEMMEKNHKHEIGVEMAHHKEVQRNLVKLNEENRELKVKLEEKERALDITNIYSRKDPTTQQPQWKASSNSLNNTPFETPREKRKDSEKKKKEIKLKPAKEEIATKDEAKTTKAILNENELKAQKEDAQLKMQEIEMKIKQQEAELKRKDAAERAKREQQQRDDEERVKQMQKQKKLDEERKREEERRKHEEETSFRNKHSTNDEDEEKKRREKERLEEEDRKKRWISTNTVNNVKLSEEKEKNSVEKSKKDELLAKLALLDTTTTISNHDSASNALKPPKSDQNVFNQTNTTNSSSLPPKPFQFNNNNSISQEYKFNPNIDNLHDGKPVNFNRETSSTSNKNELLSKLFNNNNQTNDIDSILSNNSRYHQSKLDKIDDIFVSNKNDSFKTTNGVDKAKASLMPWELHSVVKKQDTNGTHFDIHSKNEKTINRPKLDNKPLFNMHNSSNYVEDIEELAL